jgi:hypothetical protein
MLSKVFLRRHWRWISRWHKSLLTDAFVQGLVCALLTVSSASSQSLNRPPILEIDDPGGGAAFHYDSIRSVTELYSYDYETGLTRRIDINSDLDTSSVLLPVGTGYTWIAEDLDRDGYVDIVGQTGLTLRIYSSKDWSSLGMLPFSGVAGQMYPTAINIDDDRHLEIYVPLPYGYPVVIDFDSISGVFELRDEAHPPFDVYGQTAAGDFDQDGRVEFINAEGFCGHLLFEWRDSLLLYIGRIGDLTCGGTVARATACAPFPDGKTYALLGGAYGGDLGFRYQLLEATGDNTFTTVDVFQGVTGYYGIHPCWAADVDCDGLDEILTGMYPADHTWEWDTDADSFALDCSWTGPDYSVGSFFGDVDIDRDGKSEWVFADQFNNLRIVPDPDCVFCDSNGICVPGQGTCWCHCQGDPTCDGATDVIDVVLAVDVAFRNGSPPIDPSPTCPFHATDANCTGFTTVIDVVNLINVAFRNADPATEFCDPCAP